MEQCINYSRDADLCSDQCHSKGLGLTLHSIPQTEVVPRYDDDDDDDITHCEESRWSSLPVSYEPIERGSLCAGLERGLLYGNMKEAGRGRRERGEEGESWGVRQKEGQRRSLCS